MTRRIHLRKSLDESISKDKLVDIAPYSEQKFSVTLDIPPTTNKLYIQRRGGGLALSKTAITYREHVKKTVSSFIPELTRFVVTPETIYQFDISLYFERLENPGWFEFWTKDTYVTKGKKKGELKGKKGERKAKTRYKKIDYDNRIKFLQDCLVKSIGIPDDSQIFRGVQEKHEDQKNPRAECCIQVLGQDKFFLERR